mmetsp:Transcript_19178/g.35300  ORF Transcript_19178/g.35300 Transcript_19178/m.35300 type:complete len:161 (+) Transcript_19178:184-666(+)
MPTSPSSNPSSTAPRPTPSNVDKPAIGPTKFNLTAADTVSLAAPNAKTRQASNGGMPNDAERIPYMGAAWPFARDDCGKESDVFEDGDVVGYPSMDVVTLWSMLWRISSHSSNVSVLWDIKSSRRRKFVPSNEGAMRRSPNPWSIEARRPGSLLRRSAST